MLDHPSPPLRLHLVLPTSKKVSDMAFYQYYPGMPQSYPLVPSHYYSSPPLYHSVPQFHPYPPPPCDYPQVPPPPLAQAVKFQMHLHNWQHRNSEYTIDEKHISGGKKHNEEWTTVLTVSHTSQTSQEFWGYGRTKQSSRDDASRQALEYLGVPLLRLKD